MKIVCPHCNGPIINTADIAGQIVACPHCEKRLRMPAAAPADKPPVGNKPPVANKPPVTDGPAAAFGPVVNTGVPQIKSQSPAARYRDSRRKTLAAGGGFGVFVIIFIVLRVIRTFTRSANRARDQRDRERQRQPRFR